MAKGTGELKANLAALIREVFPELNGFQYPIKGRVTKVHEAGGKVGEFQKKYSIDVQPLKADGSTDAEKPVIPDVPIDIQWAGANRGMLSLPLVGSVVRIGFYYWDPSLPYVDGILADGYSVPDHPLGSFIIQQKNGVFVRFQPNGDIEIQTDQEIKLTAGSSKMTLEPRGSAKIETSTDIQLNCGAAKMQLRSSGEMDVDGTLSLAGGGPAVARVGDSVDCPCGTGHISGGSSRVNCVG